MPKPKTKRIKAVTVRITDAIGTVEITTRSARELRFFIDALRKMRLVSAKLTYKIK